jgi:hypothetical protein
MFLANKNKKGDGNHRLNSFQPKSAKEIFVIFAEVNLVFHEFLGCQQSRIWHFLVCLGNFYLLLVFMDFLQTVVSVFNGTNQRCVVIFQGPAGTGKTQLCQLFKQIVGYSAAADMNRMDVRGTGDHAFSNLVGMRLICGEEFNTGTDETKLEKIKQIFGGTPTQTAMKYANKGGLIGGFIRTPVFLTANQNPLHPVHMNIHEAAWNRRIYTFYTHSCNPQWLAENTYGSIHPLAFKAFCTKFNVDLYQ